MSEIGINSLLVLSIFSLWILPIAIYFVEHKNILNGFLDLFGNKKKGERGILKFSSDFGFLVLMQDFGESFGPEI